ncbi:hypothetical protein [Sneathiella limimaris]|uniref:hypothetical protein n=1 Tax=Sneathiella limimaris TaxID=1964213 RepID=UPI00146D1579|nr:hypothetical protein [Sneathiella limimaris]
MFSRNEKYGQALHLQYGFDAMQAATAPKSNKGFFSKLADLFVTKSANVTSGTKDAQMEFAFDKDFIEQAVQSELRNTNSAANENNLPYRHEESA